MKTNNYFKCAVVFLILALLLPTVASFSGCNVEGNGPDVNTDALRETEAFSQQISESESVAVESEIDTEKADGTGERQEIETDGGNVPDTSTDCEHDFSVQESYISPYLLCSKCSQSNFMEQYCTEHNIVEGVLPTGEAVQRCVYCNNSSSEKINCISEHSFVTEVEPTYYHVGIETAHCDECGYSRVRVLSPLNTGNYTCNLTLQEYANGAASALFDLAEFTFEDNINSGVAELSCLPFGDIATYRDIRSFTQKLVEGEKTQYEKARKIYDWVIRNIAYSGDAQMYDVGQTWATRKAVCSQYVQLMHDMLSAIDVMSAYTSGYSTYVPWNENRDVKVPTIIQHVYDTGHAVVTCYADGKILVMDPTWGISDADRYFDIDENELASYFIPAELDLIKIVPDNVDDRNYMGCIRRIGDHLLQMSHGMAAEEIGGLSTRINNIPFTYTFVTERSEQNLLIGKQQYIGSAIRSSITLDSYGIYCYLPNGRRIDFGNAFEYVALLNEDYGKSVNLPLSQLCSVYDGCLYRLKNEGYHLLSCNSKNAEVTVLGSINGIRVAEIGKKAFSDNQYVKKVIVENGVSRISISAFVGSCVEELYLPSTMPSIGAGFSDVPIRVIEVAEDSPYLKTEDNVLFSKDGKALLYYPPEKKDSEYRVPDGVTVVFDVKNNPYIEKLILPSSVESLNSFVNLPNLKFLNLPEGVRTLHQIMLSGLTEIVVPDAVTDLGGTAFAGNVSLKKLVLPSSLQSISSLDTNGCKALESVEISAENENYCSVDGVLYSKDMKSLILYPQNKPDTVYEIPEGVEKLSEFVFSSCKNLVEVRLPSTLTVLPMAAFNESAVCKVNLNYVEKLSGTTFGGCENIKVLVLPENIKEIEGQEFYKAKIVAVVIENPDLITDPETFLRAENLRVYLNYDGLTDKEKSWMPYVAGVYQRSEWYYADGFPTPVGGISDGGVGQKK